MAEVVGLVASIIGIAQLTGKLVQVEYDYIGGVKDAPSTLRKLVDELQSLSKVLTILQGHARKDKSLKFTALQSLNGQNGPLVGIHRELEKLLLKLKPGGKGLRSSISWRLKGTISKLKWPLEEGETLEHIARIERYKSTFQLALSADHL